MQNAICGSSMSPMCYVPRRQPGAADVHKEVAFARAGDGAMKAKITLRQALDDPALLGDVLPGKSWLPWRAVLLASMGEELTPSELELFTTLTGRTVPPPRRVDELWAIIGRRGGKSRQWPRSRSTSPACATIATC